MKESSQEPVQYEINKKIVFKPCLEDDANCLSKIVFFWTNALMRQGAAKPLEMNDLFDLKQVEQPQYSHKQFTEVYDSLPHDMKGKTIKTFKQMLFCVFIWSGVLAIIGNALQFSGPLMIKQILTFLSNPDEPEHLGYVFCSILVGSYLLRTLFMQHAFHKVNQLAVRAMNSSTSKIYFKVLRLSSAARKYQNTGAIMNYINVDTQAFQFFLQMSSFVFSAPIMIVASIVLIVLEVGWIGLCAPFIFFIGLYFQQRLMKKAFGLRKDQLYWSDKRSKCVNEYFTGIRIIKYYGWEDIVSDKIEAIRKQQIKLTFKGLMIRSYVEILMNMLPIFASILVFGVFVVIYGDQALKPATVYTVLSLFNLMANPMRMLVMTLIQQVNAQASLARIDHFFEFEDTNTEGFEEEDQSLEVGEIKIDKAEFRWETATARRHAEAGKQLLNKTPQQKKQEAEKLKKQKDEEKNKKKRVSQITDSRASLEEPLVPEIKEKKPEDDQLPSEKTVLTIDNLHIPRGQFVGIIGRVGSGKSTLLSAILNEVDKVKGTVKRRGTVAYVPQTSWLRSATIRENILFESEYDQQRYKEVLRICELESDLAILGGGDLTEVGERGVNLSGGQKQRISIARAVYSNADIFLIDDCLSALDSYVAKKIYNNVILEALKDKTIVFVTHAVHLVKDCNKILVMQEGGIFESGTYEELSNKEGSLFNSLQVQYKKKAEDQEKEADQKEKQLKRKESEVTIDTVNNQKKEDKFKGLVKVEERIKGSVPWSVYVRFFTGAGGCLTFLMMFFICMGQVSRVASDWWLGCWSSKRFQVLNQEWYIGVYAGISLVVGFLIYSKGYFFAKFITSSSQFIQRTLIKTLLHTPLSWFDVTPTGRILSRTTKDQDDLDNSLAFNMQFTMQNLLMLVSSILVIGVVTPIYFGFAAVSLIIYYLLIKYYMKTSVELKRLEANTRAPLISHIQETINGMYVIRAFRKKDKFVRKYFQKQKEYIVAYTNQNVCNRWISIVTDLFATATIAGSAYLGVWGRGSTTSNLIGLSLTWALQISAVLSFTLKIMADTESNMNAVVRLLDYIDHNPSEKDFNKPTPPDSENWPQAGKFEFKRVTYRYRPDLEDVIHSISFDVESNAKIGVVGRTGSGKSTLTLGLLRILELSQNPEGDMGSINLDNVDIANIGLHCLRHKVTIIPQDPTLFTGTIKSNIDPFNVYGQDQVAEALKKVEIWDQIKPAPEETDEIRQKIYSKVDDGGSNFSLGQRQLICMARALIRQPRVLLMDEATASIDEKTDQLIQKMIRKEFKQTTVITIAHRLNTIIYYDKILVLDFGRVKEYGTPEELVTDDKSFLGNLVKETGREYQEKMIYLAKNKPSQQQ